MMSASAVDRSLAGRLGRLRGAGGPSCVPEYRGRAEGIRRSDRFRTDLARIRAAADENRLLALSLLRQYSELCACEIQAATGLTHATVSHHMALLVDVGLVRARREGKWMYYRLAEYAKVGIP